MKTILFYEVEQYGTAREFIHPKNAGDAQIVSKLTGKKTIDGITRELIRDLTGGAVTFERTFKP